MASSSDAREAAATPPPAAAGDRALFLRKAFWIGVLYYSQGFPLGVFYEILPVHFRSEGVNLGEIGFLSLLGLGWSLKYLWAPIVGHLRGYRHWMLAVDLAMAALISPLVLHAGFGPWVWALVGLYVLMSATNDIAIDAYTIEMVERDEMGRANGLRIAFYRVGMLATGGLLALQGRIGWQGVYLGVAVMLALCGLACRLAPREAVVARPPTLTLAQEFRALLRTPAATGAALGLLLATTWIVDRPVGFADTVPFFWWYATGAALLLWLALAVRGERAARREADAAGVATVAGAPVAGGAPDAAQGLMFGAIVGMLRRPGMLLVLVFTLTFKLADTTIGFMVKPFWLDAGFTPQQIGIVSVQVGLLLTIAGGLVGGWITDRIGIFRALWMLGLTQAVSNLGYWVVSVVLPLAPASAPDLSAQALMYTASAVESFTQGLGTGAFLAFLMAIVDRRRSAAEYALLSSMFLFGRSVAGWIGGNLAESFGYQDFFLMTFLFGLPAYLLLPWVKRMLDYAERRGGRPYQS